VVAALKENVRAARIPHDEDDVTLPGVSLRALWQPGEAAEIDATWPLRWNFDFRSRFPKAFAQPPRRDGRLGLRLAFERPELRHTPRAPAAVVAHAKDLDLKFAGRVRANHDLQGLARGDALARAVALDQARSKLVASVKFDVGQLPVRPCPRIFLSDPIG